MIFSGWWLTNMDISGTMTSKVYIKMFKLFKNQMICLICGYI